MKFDPIVIVTGSSALGGYQKFQPYYQEVVNLHKSRNLLVAKIVFFLLPTYN